MLSRYEEFFKLKGNHVVENIKYEVYQPYGYPLVLKNKSGRVLATVQVFYDDVPIDKQNYPIPVPYEGGFQIIFQSDNSIDEGRPIKYVITNHCKESGYVKFDFGFNKVPSCETDPPENINRVNELKSFEPFAVKSNQQDSWKELIIKTKKKTNADGTTSAVDLKDETSAAPSEKVGTYLYLTVTPQNNGILTPLFKDAYWCTEDTIVVEKNYYNPNLYTHRNFEGARVARGFGDEEEDGDEDDLLGDDEPVYRGYRGGMARGVPEAAVYRGFGGLNGAVAKGMTNNNYPAPAAAAAACCFADFAPAAAFAPAPAPAAAFAHNLDDNQLLGGFGDVAREVKNVQEATKSVNLNIGESKVAEMVGGKRIIEQMGGTTNADYDYSVRTEARKIGLSILDLGITKVYSEFTQDEVKAMVLSYLEAVKRSKDMEFVDLAKSIKKYRSDVCTVCLDPDSPPNTVLVRCGHVCTCSDDCTEILKNKCPMCQANVLCKINERLFLANC